MRFPVIATLLAMLPIPVAIAQPVGLSTLTPAASMPLGASVLLRVPTGPSTFNFGAATPSAILAAGITSDFIAANFGSKCNTNASLCTVQIGTQTPTLADKLSRRIDLVPDFCAASDLADPATGSACVQRAINAICAAPRPGARLMLPPLTVKAHDVSVPCAMTFEGEAGGGSAGGTIWDYSAVTSFGLRFQPTGWPAVTHQQLLFAPAVRGVNFYTANATGTALQFYGVNSGTAERLAFTGNTNNAVLIYGAYKFNIANITGNYLANVGAGISGYGLEITGDMSGKNRLGAACTLGDCSTRTDIVTIHNWDMLGTQTGAGIYIHGTVDATMGEHISIQNKNIGLQVQCQSGFPDITYCPQFLTFTDFQAEGTTNTPFYLQDFTEFQCSMCYAIGNGAAANHALDAGFQNYTSANGGGGGLKWIGGKLGNVGSSAAYINVPDSKIVDATIIASNLANVGAVGVHYVGGANHYEAGNTYATYLGIASPAMGGTLIAAPASRVTIIGNDYTGATSGVLNNSSAGTGTLISLGNRGP